jgi:hypothetical protein
MVTLTGWRVNPNPTRQPVLQTLKKKKKREKTQKFGMVQP